MSVIARFERFFAESNGNAKPYPWQCELVERVAGSGCWPDIAAPTGTGKSSVIDAHVFLVAEHAACSDGEAGALQIARPPRRLVMVAPRRVLVDDQYTRARRLAVLLREADTDSVLGAVSRTLRKLCTFKPEGGPEANDPLGVWRLRGGVRAESGWRLEPAACQVICATPQMWGSRLLFRGYAGSRNSRNLESGLLAYDTVAIIDEAHLHERLLETGRRIADVPWGSDALQVVGMSATARVVDRELRLSDADFDEPELSKRVEAHKRIHYVEVEDLKRDAARALSDAANATETAGTVSVFVNDVPTALAVSAELRKGGATVETVCGRMRPADLASLDDDYPGLLTPHGNDKLDFLVSTQSLEVGVDLDLPAMVSLIAPASALAQRAGRLNRSGRRGDSMLTVVTLAGLAERDLDDAEDVARVSHSGPYGGAELIDGARWLQQLGDSISPRSVADRGLPDVPRPPLPALRQADLETLLMTSAQQPADPEPGLYIEDPIESRPEIWIVARRHLGLEPEVVKQALEACPPRAHELATVSLDAKAELQQLLERIRNRPEAEGRDTWVLRTADGELGAEPVAAYDELRAGDALVVPDGAPICVGRIVGLAPAKGVGSPMRDVLDATPPDVPRDWIVELNATAMQPVLELDPVLGGRAARRLLADLLRASAEELADGAAPGELADGAARRELAERLDDPHVRLVETALTWCEGAEAARGLLVARDLAARAELPSSSVAEDPVTIDAHNAAVEERMTEILAALKLDVGDEQQRSLKLAAGLHDSGKAHPSFQSRMGRRACDPPLAKPLPGHRPGVGDGWRHEQLSAAYVAAQDAGDDLAVILAASHHGRGRSLFDRGARDLLAGFDDCPSDVRDHAELLFGDGGRYELLRARITRRYGGYRLAWMEAILRCADVQVSKEGGAQWRP